MKGEVMLPGMYEWIVILFMVPIAIVINVLPFWMICRKAGFPGPLSLLMLLPIANIVLPFYIAFAEWPALRQGRDDSNLLRP
jgi:hypothetical protein